MKKRTKFGSVMALAVAFIMSITAFALITTPQTALASGEGNKSAVIKTTLSTRITKEVGNVSQTAIEFDLLSSDLKSEKNLTWCAEHPAYTYETANASDAYYYYDYTNPSVSFAFDAYSDEFGLAMRMPMIADTVGDTKMLYPGRGFEYNADGVIRMYSRYHWVGGGSRTVLGLTEIVDGELQWNSDCAAFSFDNTHPAGPYYYGSIENVKAFLNPGYSYKVEQFTGKINEDGSITYGQTMCQDVIPRENTSIAVFRKAIDASEWELLFGWYVGRSDTAAATFAGMEIISGADKPSSSVDASLRGTYRPEHYNTITMELDNLAIYGNRAKDSVITFDDVEDSAFYLNDEEGVTPGLGAYSNAYGQCFGYDASTPWDYNVINVNDVKFNLANGAPFMMATYATANLKTAPFSTNKTATIKTTLSTRIAKEVGAVSQKAIEFDLIDSDLKSPENLAWFDTHAPVVSENTNPSGNYYTLYYSGPSVQFSLDSHSAEYSSDMQFMLTKVVDDAKATRGKGGFEYNANGIIRAFSNPTPASNGANRRIYAVTEIVDGELQWNADSPYFSYADTHPAGPYYYGDISEVESFLDAGYSYKVELFLGKINADGTITYGQTMCQDGHVRENYSIAVFKKALGADEWQLSFGWYCGREVYTGPFAGIEILSGMNFDESIVAAENRGTYRPEKYNTVTMEIDNLAIYGNRNRDSVTTFDGVSNSDFYLNDEEGVTAYLGGYSDSLGQCFGWPNSGWDLNEFTVNGIDFTLANTAPAYMATYATCNLNTYKNVTAVIGEYSEVGYISAVDGEYFIELPDSDFDLADYDLEGYVLIGWLDDAGNLYKPAEVVTLEDVSTTFTAVYGSIVNYDKASVRVKDNEGIRFMATVGGNVATLDPSAYAFSVTFTEGTKTLTGDIDKSKLFANGNGTYSFYSVLTGLDGLESTVFKADANVTITYHDGSTLTFSAEDMTEGRSYIQVVTAALNDVSEVQDAEYFYEVTVGSVTAYSRYANEHFNAMLEVYEDVIGSAFEFDAQ